MPQVFIPPSLRRHANGETVVKLDGASVRELLDQLDARFPGIKARLCEGDRLKPGLAVAVDSRMSELGLMQSVDPNSEVHFINSVGGGC